MTATTWTPSWSSSSRGLASCGRPRTRRPLLIVNGNQFVFEDVVEIVHYIRDQGADGGIMTFPNVHPRWSYVRLGPDGESVRETSEKRPISRATMAE